MAALWRAAFGYTTPHNDPLLTIEKKRAVQPELFLVAVEGPDLLGTVMGGYDGHRGWIYSLAVAPQHRRKGIATLLVREMERALSQRGCPKINLQILNSNAQVVRFYQSLGYSVEERISMAKVL